MIATNIPPAILQTAGMDSITTNNSHNIIYHSALTLRKLVPLLNRSRSQDTDTSRQTLTSSAGTMLYVLAKVPSLWTRGESLVIKFELYNDDFETHVTTLAFIGYDKGFTYFSQITEIQEFHVEKTVGVRRFSYGVQYLSVTIPQYTSVGIKKGVAQAGGDANYHKDFGYSFVEKFGPQDFPVLPPSDSIAQMCNSNTYYWEGLPMDGLNIAPEHALYHPDNWQIEWNAANLVDPYVLRSTWNTVCVWPLWLSNPLFWISVQDSDKVSFLVAHLLTLLVNSKMTYVSTNTTPYYSQDCADADLLIITAGWKGACDEFATMEISLLRALGIPARRMSGGNAKNGHAWLEAWLNGAPSSYGNYWQWFHMDPTINLWCDAGYYRRNWHFNRFKIDVEFDDSLISKNSHDGNDINQILDNGLSPKGDLRYEIDYTGPNNY